MTDTAEVWAAGTNVQFAQPLAGITFHANNKVVFSITGDGRLEAGEGLSNDEATRALFDVIAKNVPCFISALRERAEKAEAELAEWKANPLAR